LREGASLVGALLQGEGLHPIVPRLHFFLHNVALILSPFMITGKALSQLYAVLVGEGVLSVGQVAVPSSLAGQVLFLVGPGR